MQVSSRKDECFYKATNGSKRHLAVDTLGFPFFTHCTRANVSDDAGLPIDVDAEHEVFPVKIDEHSQDYNLVRSWLSPLDHGYHPEHLTQELELVYPQSMRKIKFELSTKPSPQEKAAQGKSGFVPAVARWVIERSNA